MKTKIIIKAAIGILLSIILWGCTKDTVVGPTGPIGATGPTGPAGNANIEEYDFVVTSQDWKLSGNTWTATYSSLTINKTDAVQVFMVNGSVYTALNIISAGIQTSFSNDLQDIYINVSSINNVAIPNPGNVPFKIVIIP